MPYCYRCGSQVRNEDKFCQKCGAKVYKPENDVSNQRECTSEIYRCPSCGAGISPLYVACPFCGMEFTKKKVVYSVSELSAKIAELEAQRNVPMSGSQSFFDCFRDIYNGSKYGNIAVQEMSLIKSFPIPNTIEEIVEFVILADGSINIHLSKSTFSNNLSRLPTAQKNDDQGISDAWVSKLEQAYNKAEMLFPNHPLFVNIEKIYKKKMQQLGR